MRLRCALPEELFGGASAANALGRGNGYSAKSLARELPLTHARLMDCYGLSDAARTKARTQASLAASAPIANCRSRSLARAGLQEAVGWQGGASGARARAAGKSREPRMFEALDRVVRWDAADGAQPGHDREHATTAQANPQEHSSNARD